MSHIFQVTHIFWSAGCSTVSALCSPRSAPLHRVNINNSGAEKAIFISCSLPFSLRTFRQSLLMGDGVAQTHRLVLSVLSASEADLQVKVGDIFQTSDKSFLANGNVCLSPLFILFISHTFSPPPGFYKHPRFPQHWWSVGKGELWPPGPDPSPALAQREHWPLWRRPREDHHLRLRSRGLLRQPPHPLTPLGR